MQYPDVPIFRFLSTAGWPSKNATNALASITAVSGLSAPASVMRACRVAGSLKSGCSGAVGAFLVRVKGIDDQDRVARPSEAGGHLLEGRTKSENIRPNEHPGEFSLGGMHEIPIGSSVGSFYLDVRSAGRLGIGKSRQRRHQPGTQRHRTKLPASYLARESSKLIEIVLFAHINSDGDRRNADIALIRA